MANQPVARDTMDLASVKTVNDAAMYSKTIIDDMEEVADQAHTSLTGILEDALEAHTWAGEAKQDAADAEAAAVTANTAAHTALNSASIVEDVAGTLDWIRKHGQYILSTDTTVDPDTVYFIYDSVKQDYDPIAIPDPTKNPQQEGWYVLDIKQAQSDYIMAHLAVTNRGLWVLPNGMGTGTTPDTGETQEDSDARQGSGYKALLSNSGMEVYDGSGVLVAKYGANIEFDSGREHTIGNQNSYIKYYNDDGTFKIEIKADEVVFKGDDLDTIISDGGRIEAGTLYIDASHVTELDELLSDKQDVGDYMTNDEYDYKIKDIASLFNTLNGQIIFGDDGTNTYILLQNHAKDDPNIINGVQAKLTSGKLAFGTFGQTDNEVAYFSSEELKVQKRLSFGNFVMKQRDNGHLSIMYEGGVN